MLALGTTTIDRNKYSIAKTFQLIATPTLSLSLPHPQLLKALEMFDGNLDDYLHLLLPPVVKLFDSQENPIHVRRSVTQSMVHSANHTLIHSHSFSITNYCQTDLYLLTYTYSFHAYMVATYYFHPSPQGGYFDIIPLQI